MHTCVCVLPLPPPQNAMEKAAAEAEEELGESEDGMRGLPVLRPLESGWATAHLIAPPHTSPNHMAWHSTISLSCCILSCHPHIHLALLLTAPRPAKI